MKICSKCGVEKAEICFHPEPKMKDGYRNDCIECRKAYHRENSKKHYARTRKVKLVKVKAYNLARHDSYLAYLKQYRKQEGYTEKERLRSKERRTDPTGNPHRAFLSRRYIARRFENAGYCSKQQLAARWDYYGSRCWICSLPAKETDHVKPVSKGGTNWPANLRPICKTCNVRKGNNWPYTIQLLKI